MKLRTIVRFTAAFLCVVALAGCKTSSERAEDHYITANELMAEEKPRQAVVELRNAVRLNEYHGEARFMLAEILREQRLYG